MNGMSTSANRVQLHRDRLRKAGLRPIQIWVPDTRRPDFIHECRRQSQLVVSHDRTDTELAAWMNEAVIDIEGWD